MSTKSIKLQSHWILHIYGHMLAKNHIPNQLINYYLTYYLM
jgi:hypothetical protein